MIGWLKFFLIHLIRISWKKPEHQKSVEQSTMLVTLLLIADLQLHATQTEIQLTILEKRIPHQSKFLSSIWKITSLKTMKLRWTETYPLDAISDSSTVSAFAFSNEQMTGCPWTSSNQEQVYQ